MHYTVLHFINTFQKKLMEEETAVKHPTRNETKREPQRAIIIDKEHNERGSCEGDEYSLKSSE